ncbi:ribonuclease T2 family protein [Magnetospirillum molischianum]|uniref:Ribonuclease I n=1 Tax=Magnetospirillum molischianum DSM 120 TaxID=1150626 RepID=H8FRK6_MAGML|nr:ribonuclease I [Magnetospirillum molischianum]CCG40994.1 Ribonuclease I [Magnetospirillum molischianum DSM 120]
MKRTLLFVFVMAALLGQTPQVRAETCAPARGSTGQFDYYLLSLSWSPSFCATPAGAKNPDQCGTVAPARGFVVHGLWPQYLPGSASSRGGGALWPQCCSGAESFRPDAVPPQLDELMIGTDLRRHEWNKHGVCATPRTRDYFASIVQAVQTVGTAADLRPTAPVKIRVTDLKRYFLAPPQAIFPTCKGKTISEVRICLDRSLAPIACPDSASRSDNCPGTIVLPVGPGAQP